MDPATETMTAEEHTAAALHAALDACLADDTAGHEKAKKMAKMIKAMHDDKPEAKSDGGEKSAESEGEKKEPAAEKKEEKSEEGGSKETAAKEEEKQEQARIHKELTDRFEQQSATISKLEKQLEEQGKITTRHEQALSARSDLKQTIAKVEEKAAKVTDLKKFWDPATVPATV